MTGPCTRAGGERPSGRWQAVAWFSLAAVCLTALYAWSYADCTRAFFCFDDFWELAAADRIHIHSPLDIVQFFYTDSGFYLYRPVSTRLYFYLLHASFGYDPGWYHRTQILFHIFNALLVYLISTALFCSRPAALASAVVYATAPGHAIAACHNALFTETGAAFWYFLGLWTWLRPGGRWRVALVASLFGIALLASEHAVSFPIVLTMSTVIIGPRQHWRGVVREQGAIYLVAGTYVAAKLYYLYYFLPATISPAALAFLRSTYGLAFSLESILSRLAVYATCALDFAYYVLAPDTCALPLGMAFTGVAALSTLCILVGWWPARPVRLAVFGLDFFIVTLAPVLVLTGRVSSHYVGIAGLGVALALVGFVRALPRFSAFAVGCVFTVLIVVHVSFTATQVRQSGEFRFFSGFSLVATRWLYTLSLVTAPATVPEMLRDVYVPKNLVTDMVFEVANAHQLFLCARYRVHTSSDLDAIQPLGGRLILHEPLPLPVAYATSWRWLRTACAE